MKPWESQRTPLVLLAALLGIVTGIGGLSQVSVQVPQSVSPGDDVTMQCKYNLDSDQLYTVKWYKGRQEFFRYVPKEHPNTQVFPLTGISVDVSHSNAHQVVLKSVSLDMADKYRCEVSTDHPNFHTEMVAGTLHVVYLPGNDNPVLAVEKSRYAVGEMLRANCSVSGAHPPANITWYLNDVKVNSTWQTEFPTPPGGAQVVASSYSGPRYLDEGARVTVQAGLELEVLADSFQYGKARLECRAALWHLWQGRAQQVLEEERPRLASVLGTRESNRGRSLVYTCPLSLLVGSVSLALLR